MSLDEVAYVKHMLDEARYLEGAAAAWERAAFLRDPTLQRERIVELESLPGVDGYVTETAGAAARRPAAADTSANRPDGAPAQSGLTRPGNAPPAAFRTPARTCAGRRSRPLWRPLAAPP